MGVRGSTPMLKSSLTLSLMKTSFPLLRTLPALNCSGWNVSMSEVSLRVTFLKLSTEKGQWFLRTRLSCFVHVRGIVKVVLRTQNRPQHLCKSLNLVGQSPWCLLLVGRWSHLSRTIAIYCVFVEITNLHTVTILALFYFWDFSLCWEQSFPLQLKDPNYVAQTWAKQECQMSSLLGLEDFTGICCLGYSMEWWNERQGGYISLSGHLSLQPARLRPEENRTNSTRMKNWICRWFS